LAGVAPDDMPGSIYELMARGEFAGSLIHSPNVYDFPVSLQIARQLGATPSGCIIASRFISAKRGWMTGPICSGCRASWRVPGPHVLETLCDVAKGWNTDRYHAGAGL